MAKFEQLAPCIGRYGWINMQIQIRGDVQIWICCQRIWSKVSGNVHIYGYVVAHVAGEILVPSTFLAEELPCEVRGIFASGKATRENPACHISYEFRPTFVTLFGTIWLPNHKELCNEEVMRNWPANKQDQV